MLRDAERGEPALLQGVAEEEGGGDDDVRTRFFLGHPSRVSFSLLRFDAGVATVIRRADKDVVTFLQKKTLK